MLQNQIVQKAIDDLKMISKVELAVYGPTGAAIASTFGAGEDMTSVIEAFVNSSADSQVMGPHHLLKMTADEEVLFVVDAWGLSEDTYMIGRIAVSQLQALAVAYHDKFDRNTFFQNLILDNMLLVDIYNRAKRLHIADTVPRVVFLVESKSTEDSMVAEVLRGMYAGKSGDYVTAVDEQSVVLIKAFEDMKKDAIQEQLEEIAESIVDTVSAEAMVDVRVAFGCVVDALKDVSKSYKEAAMAAEVGRIFYQEKKVVSYRRLGIGRLIYQLPQSLCVMFMDEVFGGELPEELDEETLATVDKFFENNLNVSETARQLFVHRNTLVYRIEKLLKVTGLDIRVFEDALTLKIALMVASYQEYLRNA